MDNLIKIVVVLALLASIVWGINHYAEGERKAGYNTAVAEYTIKVNAAQEAYRLLERKGAADQVLIANNLTKEYDHALQQKDLVIAHLRDGSLRLRDPKGTTSCRSTASPSAVVSGNNGEAGCELSRETSEALVSEASRADKIVKQLNAAQAALLNDRKVCK